MAVTDAHDADLNDENKEPEALVSALRTSPERTVFTEEDNSDGWIATDFVVEPRR